MIEVPLSKIISTVRNGKTYPGRRLGAALQEGTVREELAALPAPTEGGVRPYPPQLHVRLVWDLGFRTQSKIVAQLTLLVAITVLHRSCSVAADPLHR